MSIWIFALGLFLISLGLPVKSDWEILQDRRKRSLAMRAGISLVASVLVLADFNAQAVGMILLAFFLGLLFIELLFWMDDGRFTPDRRRASIWWFLSESGPGDPPVRNGFLVMAAIVAIFLAVVLVVRPVVRYSVGLADAVIPHIQQGEVV